MLDTVGRILIKEQFFIVTDPKNKQTKKQIK